MAVSYRLYSLYVRPAEVRDPAAVTRIIADVTGLEESHLTGLLNGASGIVEVADHLERPQVDMIRNAGLAGLYVKPVEERFYPENETAAALVGFTGKGIGISGAEGMFDVLLQDGEFRADTLPGVDFGDSLVLGRDQVDIVLTIDLALQENVERKLREAVEARGATRGAALLMDPRSGAILAWAASPSFNPNYYWQWTEAQRRSLFQETLDPELFRTLKARAAAARKTGESGDFLPPRTIASPDYGLSPEEISALFQDIGADGKERCVPESPGTTAVACKDREADCLEAKDPVTLAAVLAEMINGGRRVTPRVLEGVYDHATGKMFRWRRQDPAAGRSVSPAMGIRIRRELLSILEGTENDMMMTTDAVEKVVMDGNASEYVRQEALFALVPARTPELMLLMVTSREGLDPLDPATHKRKEAPSIGRELLAGAYDAWKNTRDDDVIVAASVPAGHDETNYSRFLIASRMDYTAPGSRKTERVVVMPQLVGLSLRKGLQRLGEYNLEVKIQGSGQIVSQVPEPGASLQGVGECVLTLSPKI
ncbi:MAG: hypothetical protein Kow0089_00190 [Desulfobulbaceae bacterium]